MGCSQSTHVVEHKRKSQPPIQVTHFTQIMKQDKIEQRTKIRQIPERGDCFLIGSLSEKQQVFVNVKLESMSINMMSVPSGGFICHNFSSILQIKKGQYFISGGINHDLTSITNACYFYYSDQHKVEQLPHMSQPRYTHNSIYFPLQNYIYVIGGRYYGDDSEAILSHCQKYLINQKKWVSLPSMNIKRCTCFTLIWNDIIYALGGYTGPYQRSTKIEYLDEIDNKWKYLDVQLNRGLQGAILLPTNVNQITIFGGLTNSGPTDSVITINLKDKSIRSRRKLYQKRSLYKSFYNNGKVYFFGGDDQFTCEIYDIVKQNSQLIKKEFSFSVEDFDSLGFSTASVLVSYQEETQLQSSNSEHKSKFDQIVYILGTTQEPFMCKLNISIPEAQFKSVPLALKLYAHQGGVFISQKQLILFGGIQNDSLSVISSDTYLFNIDKNIAKKIASMNQNRYAFSYQTSKNLQSNPQYIFCFGGATSNTEGQLIFLNACERYSIHQNKWELISPLPQKIISPMSLTFNNNIFVFGGTNDKKQKVKSIYMYQQNQNQWTSIQSKLIFGIEAGSVAKISPNQFYIFGGLLENGQTDGIWSLYFDQKNKNNKKQINCIFQQKGRMNQKKAQHKIYQPTNQDFYVVFGGDKNCLTFYRKNLQEQTSDLLINMKEMFMDVLQQLNCKNLKGYLILSSNQSS